MIKSALNSLTFLLIFSMPIANAAQTALRGDSPTATNIQKTIFVLPRLDNEKSHRIVLTATIIEKRSCNDPQYIGAMSIYPQQNLQVHSYILHIHNGPREMMMKPCPAQMTKAQVDGAFVLPYDSSKPLAIYAPKGFTVSYSVYQGNQTVP